MNSSSKWLGSAVLTASTLFMWGGSTGCKTDALSRPRTEPNGPVTALENPAGVKLPDIPVNDRAEIDMVEEMMLHRAMYARYLRAMVVFYSEHGYENKANWARNELNDLKHVKPYSYVQDSEVPVATLKPTVSVAEADKLYQEGIALMKKGGHGIPVFYNQDTMKLALAKFKDLVDQYPNSDKIDDAAYMIAEIHKEYFQEKDNGVALEWYQRALDWNPETPHPARFQMAVVYDYRLHEREKALALYQQVLEKERFNKSNVEWSVARIKQLTTEQTRHAPAEAASEPPSRPEPTGSPEPAAAGQGSEASPPPAKAP